LKQKVQACIEIEEKRRSERVLSSVPAEQHGNPSVVKAAERVFAEKANSATASSVSEAAARFTEEQSACSPGDANAVLKGGKRVPMESLCPGQEIM
jgi:hypothetical protein